MFGTGTRGFAIITILISSGTYAVVFGLLHQEYQRTVSSFLYKCTQLALRAPREIFKPKLIAKKFQQGVGTKQGIPGQEICERQNIAADDIIEPIARNSSQSTKGKRKEPLAEEVVAEASQQSLAKGRPSVIDRFQVNDIADELNQILSKMEEGLKGPENMQMP